MSTEQDIANLMDVVKDAMASVARSVLEAKRDGNISMMEYIMIVANGSVQVAPIVGAIQALSDESLEEIIDALANSDIIIKS